MYLSDNQAWLAGSALADVVIAVSMIICLQRLKRGFGTVNVILNRLITLVVETGGLTGMYFFIQVVMHI